MTLPCTGKTLHIEGAVQRKRTDRCPVRDAPEKTVQKDFSRAASIVTGACVDLRKLPLLAKKNRKAGTPVSTHGHKPMTFNEAALYVLKSRV